MTGATTAELLLWLRDVRVSTVEAPYSPARELVRGIDLGVAPGESVGIVGESGSGKSLTLRAVLGLLPRGVEISGGAVERNAAGVRARMIFQEPLTALNPTRRIRDLIGDALKAAGVPRAARDDRVLELLEEVGMPEPLRRAAMWPHEISGGQRQRVMIAMALAADPDVLLCDEPTTALDVTVQAQILALLDRMRHERGLALVFVSHDLAVVSQLCTRVLVMTDGRVVEEGPTSEVFTRPQHPYSRRLLAASRAMAGERASLQDLTEEGQE